MLKYKIHLFLFVIASIFLTGCRDDDFLSDTLSMGPDGEIMFDIGIESDGTRSAVDESKTTFQIDELIHVRAEFDCELNGEEYKEYRYGVLKYSGKGIWEPYDAQHKLTWLPEAKTASFTAYYINGSNGVLNANAMDPKLISDYAFDEIPLHAEAPDVRYGQAVKLPMRRVFALLTLTEIKEGISDEMWFTIPEPDEGNKDPLIIGGENGGLEDMHDVVFLNNAFRILFDPENNYEMKQEFSRVESTDYQDGKGNPLAYIKSRMTVTEKEDSPGETVTEVNFLLQPGAYHKFNLLYPRSRTTYATYLTYGRDLALCTSQKGFVGNGRYTFSILKSLGVIVEETPEEGWDESNPTVIVDVEAFLKAVNSGSNYSEKDPLTDEEVQILEATTEGTRLLRNVDFRYEYYDIFENGLFSPTLNSTFNGDYHYIYHMGCPLFHQNDGTIINLGIRDAETKQPVTSSENLERFGTTIDKSYNGFICSINNGTVSNVRVVNANMTIQVQTSDPDEPTQEAHNASLLFGVNRGTGNVYDIGLSGELILTVKNAPGQTLMPRVAIGAVAGQNLGTIYGMTPIEDDGYASPRITLYNNCNGSNGVFHLGGLVGNNTGNLCDLFINSITVDASRSDGLESYLGGMVGENSYSTSGTPRISGCIVRGEVFAGTVTPVINLNSYSYIGGVAGSFNVQAEISDCSVSVGITDNSTFNEAVNEYAVGGAFGVIEPQTGNREGGVNTLACFGSALKGHGYVGNFAGVVPAGFGWDHYKDNTVNVRKLVADYVGFERSASNPLHKKNFARRKK